ncbi:MAG: hypothetical protein AAFV53_22355 [Myxococcota bacterium]
MRQMFPLIIFMAACNTPAPEENPKNVVITGSGHSSATTEGFDKHKFSCCDQASLTQVVGAYVALSEAMAADDLNASRAASTRLAETSLTAAGDTNLSEDEQAALTAMNTLLVPWASDDLEGMRADLSEVNGHIQPIAANHAGKADGSPVLTVVSAFCPMAPGRWLQAETGLRNPYYGAEMLTCGVFEPATVAVK